jgi:hypothetical protein
VMKNGRLFARHSRAWTFAPMSVCCLEVVWIGPLKDQP